jgi:Ssp1 endopeptidase immunity protein Rap1a
VSRRWQAGVRTLLLTLAIVLPLRAAAQSNSIARDTGARLLARCEPAIELVDPDSTETLSRRRYGEAMSCLGFVDGFLYGHGWAAWREHRDMFFCPPEDLSAAEGARVLVDYLRRHRERLDSPAHVLLFSALSEAYPCTPALER